MCCECSGHGKYRVEYFRDIFQGTTAGSGSFLITDTHTGLAVWQDHAATFNGAIDKANSALEKLLKG